MSTYYRYPVDLTGTNRDNLVSGELISLNDRPIRVAVPIYGPFFVEGLTIFDNLTQKLLTKGTDYRVPMILQEPTLRTGKEIADAFLIENSNISSQLRVTYQAIGGVYQSNVDNIIKIYESFLNDNRSVDWVSGIYGKPSTYPPSAHPTWLSDIFGFEPLATELERIAKAIELANVPAFEMILSAINSKGASKAEMEAGEPIAKFVTLEGLLHVLDKYGFNQILLKPKTTSVKNGKSLWFKVDASYVPQSSKYVWELEHVTTTADDFAAQNGIVNLTDGEGEFMVQSLRTLSRETSETFRVLLRLNTPTGPVVARSKTITMTAHGAVEEGGILDAMTSGCYKSPRIKIGADTLHVSRSLSNASYS